METVYSNEASEIGASQGKCRVLCTYPSSVVRTYPTNVFLWGKCGPGGKCHQMPKYHKDKNLI